MEKVYKLFSIICLFVVIGIIGGCNKKNDDTGIGYEESYDNTSDLSDVYVKTGIVRYEPYPRNIDGCKDHMITIQEDDPVSPRYYKPDYLSDKFKINNLNVEVTYRITEEKYNCGYGGYVPVIHILKIKKI